MHAAIYIGLKLFQPSAKQTDGHARSVLDPDSDACAHRILRKKMKPPPSGAPLKPQGTGGHKRTPTSAFDTAAGKDEYEPERVIAERLARGTTH